MSQITARLPDDMVAAIDHAARTLNRSRAEIIRKSIEHYLEDFNDLNTAIDRLRDPADEVLDWEQAKRDLLSAN
jgi:RHH-type rel operon transcriptional repressor/antitoxin RelB